MNNRRAFTLTEFVVVAVIILAIVGLLLPFVFHSRRMAVTTTQKFDFQAISAALEAYRADFGDYPRNTSLAKWKTMQDGPGAPPTPAPPFYSLATALLGPGPAVTRTIDGDVQSGDGNDGLGIRCQSMTVASGTVAATQGSAAVTMTLDPDRASGAAEFVKSFVDPTKAGPTPASITLFAYSKQPYPETIGIGGVTQSGNHLHLTLLVAPCYPHDGRGEIQVAGGKVWGPYLAPGRFKVGFVPSVNSYGAPFFSYGQSVLMDDWGQVIEYFPRYGRMNNRTGDSVYPSDPSVQAGPLFGYSQPKSVDAVNGANAIWDWRDGAPFMTIKGQVGPAQVWPDPTTATSKRFRPELAIQWMLGDSDASGCFKNEIGAGRKVGYDGPYILISGGPDGPDRFNGGFCNFVEPESGNPLPDNQLQKTFLLSGNIYNFERP